MKFCSYRKNWVSFHSATSTESRLKWSVRTKSIHPTNFASFNSTKYRPTSQRNSLKSITIKRNFFSLCKQHCSRSQSLVFNRDKNMFFPTTSIRRHSLELKAFREKNMAIWQIILQAFKESYDDNAIESEKTLTQLKEKWKSLVDRSKKIKDNNIATGRGRD